ncbi:hypothetical protein [Ferruginibacter sp.]
MRSFFLSLLAFFLFSCKEEKKLDYNNRQSLYNETVTCLLQKREGILKLQDSSLQAISIYQEDLERLNLCKQVDALFRAEPLSFIFMEKDGTVSFYATIRGNTLRAKQFIVMRLKDTGLLSHKITSDMKVKKISDDGWYELERSISIAN